MGVLLIVAVVPELFAADRKVVDWRDVEAERRVGGVVGAFLEGFDCSGKVDVDVAELSGWQDYWIASCHHVVQHVVPQNNEAAAGGASVVELVCVAGGGLSTICSGLI